MTIERADGSAGVDPYVLVERNLRTRAAGGQWTAARDKVRTNQQAMTSGVLRLSFFTAVRSETITQIRSWSGAAAAAATPTLCRTGVYEVDSSGNLGNLKAHANDTAMWNALNKTETKTLTTPLSLVAGRYYAAAALVVSGTTVPQLISAAPIFYLAIQAELFTNPPVHGCLTGQTDLPASITLASLAAPTGGDHCPLFCLLP